VEVPQQAYDENLWEGMERMSATWFDNQLVQQWIPTVPDVQAKLLAGANVADVGCGGGRALIQLAQAFPKSRFVGYDVFEHAIGRATANAENAGVTDRVRFEPRNVIDGLPEQYDLITTFDAVHDFINPHAGLQAIHRGLLPDGTYLMLELNSSGQLEGNTGPAGVIMYGTSVLYNTPVSLANGGNGVSIMGFPESEVRHLCTEAGFSNVRRLVETPFNVLYEVKP
jgi:2-polyprenyl-3-methyl-5-hydroxy-6-metoxy-1,4-benzoquinol methylase